MGYNLFNPVYVIIQFVIIIVRYLPLIRLRFVELGFRQIKRKYIQCNTIQYNRVPIMLKTFSEILFTIYVNAA